MKKDSVILGLCVVGLISMHVTFGIKFIRSAAPTYDEPVHATAGYVYWKTGDYRYNGYHHPAFAELWAAVPWLIFKPILPYHHPAWLSQQWGAFDQYKFADIILYKNKKIGHEKLMNSARGMQLFLSVLFGVGLFFAGFLLVGRICGLIALSMWAFSPTFLSHGSIVSTDLLHKNCFGDWPGCNYVRH